MSEWKEYRFTEAATLTNGRAYLQPELQDAGKYKIVRVGNLSGGDNWFYSDMELPEDKYCHKGDLLYAWACSFGPYIWNEDKTIYHYHIWKVDVNKALTDKYYLYYYLKYYTPKWMGLTNGSVMMHITKGSLEKQMIRLPDLDTQRNIASILSSLDDKIAVNKKICENLEAQAQALFKHWFVDFAPFKDGKFIESELGLIPEGWRVGTLGDVAELRKPSIKPQDNILYTHYSIPAFDNNKRPSIDEGSTIKSNKFGISDGAVLLSKLNPSTKRIWYTGNVPEHSVSSTEFLPFYSINKEFTPFIYCYLNCDRNYREIANGAKGTTNSHQRIDANSILIRALAYSEEVIRKFCDCTQSLMELILEANQESLRLATLRDTLLPKLMSGQIKV
jgi:type I restriction enzyme S subunit